MVPDNEIVVTKLENKCNSISIFFVLMHFTGQKKKSNGVKHSVPIFSKGLDFETNVHVFAPNPEG